MTVQKGGWDYFSKGSLTDSLAGERNPGAANEYQVGVDESEYSVVDVADNSTVVTANPALLFGIVVNTVLSAHALPIKDNATTVITIPASAAAGSIYTFPGIKFNTNLTVDPDDSATGGITVLWRDQ